MRGRFGDLSSLLPLEPSLSSALRLCHCLPTGTRPGHEPLVLCSIGGLTELGTKGMGDSPWLLVLGLTLCLRCPPLPTSCQACFRLLYPKEDKTSLLPILPRTLTLTHTLSRTECGSLVLKPQSLLCFQLHCYGP